LLLSPDSYTSRRRLRYRCRDHVGQQSHDQSVSRIATREPPCRGSGIEVGRLDNAFWAEPDANGATLRSRNGYDFDRFTIAVHSRHRSVDTRANAKLSSLRGPNTGAAPAFHTSAPSSAAGTTRHSSRSGTIVRTHIPGSPYRTVGQHPTRERATGTRHLHVAIDHLYSTAVCRLTRPRFCSEYSAPSAVEFASCICVRHGNHRHSGAYARQKA
jgi:hypothetical protein